ncbi:hypothetical protein NPIL_223431 [Nephila pilipes]|uniref:Uncharacterized protein n=1 Tax=Nephila pilipes TaxID=299642 RepID=A0A8X6JS56_NEPPI|nr:hypothetical protein NPIL_223431 [Nephila pilipes]
MKSASDKTPRPDSVTSFFLPKIRSDNMAKDKEMISLQRIYLRLWCHKAFNRRTLFDKRNAIEFTASIVSTNASGGVFAGHCGGLKEWFKNE